MTDLEKRAHDLAIFSLYVQYDRDYRDTGKQGGNIVAMYPKSYKDFLIDLRYDEDGNLFNWDAPHK